MHVQIRITTLLWLFILSPLSAIGDEQPAIKFKDSRLHSINYAADSLQHWVSKARQGDTTRGVSLARDLEKLQLRFGRIPATDAGEYAYVSKRLADLRRSIQAKSGQVEAKALSKTPSQPQASNRCHPGILSIAKMLSNLEQDLPRYQDNTKQRTRMQSDLMTLKGRFARLPVTKHPDYVTTQKQLARVELALTGEPLDMNREQVAAYLLGIQVKYSEKIRLPEVRDIMTNRELTAADVDAILQQLHVFGENADKDLPRLRRVVEATGNGEYWLKWLETNSIEQLKRNMKSIKVAIDKRIDSGLRDTKYRSELDPKKNKYAFTNEAMRKQHDADHARTLRTIQQATRLEKELGLPATWSPKLAELQSYIAAYQAKAKSATEVQGLPVEVGSKLQHAIAREVLGNKKYGVGKIVQLVVNSKPIPRDRVEHKPFNGSIETIVRKWDQFQVTTVEDENGKLTVYVNDLVKFSRAPNPTPIGTWILKKRFKSGVMTKAIGSKQSDNEIP